MLKNYLKIAFRTVLKHKGYSFINIAGLSLGMACSVLILLWVQDELSFDQFHENGQTLYRVEEDQYYSGQLFHTIVTPYPSAPVWRDEIPEIMNATRYSWPVGMLMRFQDTAFFENNIRAADPSFLEMLTFPLMLGDSETALNNPFSIVISEEISEKYFPGQNPIGKILTANNKYDFIITGVMQNLPTNSHLQFDMLVPFDFTKELGWYSESWGNNSIQTFVQLQPNSQIPEVNNKLTTIVRKHNEDSTTDFVLAPFTGMHLHEYAGYGRQVGQVQYVYIFTVVAFFVLLLACVNFMNLATARSANRAKEIGMRKVSGAFRANIAFQFLGESLLMAFTSLILAVILVTLVMPVFNTLAGKELTALVLLRPATLASLVVVASLTGLVAGSYPALFLSGLRPVSVLKGSLKSGAKSSSLRKVLVVAQFALSVFLIIGTGIVYGQLQFMKNKNLGYDKEHLLYISMRGDIEKSYAAYKRAALAHPEILSVTATRHRPTVVGSNSSAAEWDGKDPELELLVSRSAVAYDYLKTMKIELIEGRDFSPDYPSDAGTDSTGAFLINKKFAEIMGLEPIIGARLDFGIKGQIIGVMKDFHFNSVRVAVDPLAISLNPPEKLSFMAIRIRPGDISNTMDILRDEWSRIIPNYPFEFKFVDEELDRNYRSEQRMADLLKYFAVLAIIISCLGLFGLASFMAEQRTKEIGVRKVLGATVANIVTLLSKEFTTWVLLANLIAWPLAYLAMANWLQKFAYRIDIGWTLFFMAGALALIVALLTVSSQALKSAVTNPAKALRYE